MDKTFGFIGAGNMGSALAGALSKNVPAQNIYISNRSPGKAKELSSKLGANFAQNSEIAADSYFIFLGVKPQGLDELFSEIGPVLKKRSSPYVLISMLAGVETGRIKQLAGENAAVIRIMPNTPCLIGEGVVLYNADCGVSAPDREAFLKAMAASGELIELPESLFDAGCAVSGCGPAFVDIFMDAFAKGGASCGLDYETALRLAALTVSGAAKLLLFSGKKPDELKTAVCSPGGATIEGVKIIEASEFGDTLQSAVRASYKRSTELK